MFQKEHWTLFEKKVDELLRGTANDRTTILRQIKRLLHCKADKNERYCDSLSQTLRVRKKAERAGRR